MFQVKEHLRRSSAALLMAGFILATSCTSKEKQKSAEKESKEQEVEQIILAAENFVGASDAKNITTGGADQTYMSSNAEGWILLDVDVPIAGRYAIEISLSSDHADTTTVWIEDHADNKDGRNYNITGNMELIGATDGFVKLHKDGSPLNQGGHKVKVHFDKAVKIAWIKLTLIKAHELTPMTLTQKTEGTAWKVVWSDDFDGTELDTTKWTYDIGNWGWGNNELQYYTKNRKENTRLEDGALVIEARKGDMGEKWTSARITTRGKVSFLYGKIEFRAKTPTNKGNWAAGWTLGDDYVDEKSWPYCGEIDIMESVGYEMDDDTGNGIAHASVHCGAYYFKLGNQPTSVIDVLDMYNEYHTYAIEWTPEGIKAFVDDQHYFTYSDTNSELAWPFSRPQNIILNLAMGGGWGGAMGMDESVSSQKLVIDYVRVYELQ